MIRAPLQGKGEREREREGEKIILINKTIMMCHSLTGGSSTVPARAFTLSRRICVNTQSIKKKVITFMTLAPGVPPRCRDARVAFSPRNIRRSTRRRRNFVRIREAPCSRQSPILLRRRRPPPLTSSRHMASACGRCSTSLTFFFACFRCRRRPPPNLPASSSSSSSPEAGAGWTR